MTYALKQNFKRIEVPLNKFTLEAIPHHEKLILKNKNQVKKLISQCNNLNTLNRELQDIKRTVRQLKDLMYELDTLRTQVEDDDLDKFDLITLSCRKTILTIISEYNSLQKQLENIIALLNSNIDRNEEHIENNPFEGAQKIQITENLDKLKLQQYENVQKNVENLENDIEDIHDIYKNLGNMVNDQKENVNRIEGNIEETLDNVQEGNRLLSACSKMKTAAYPVTGAIIGTCLGGPIGFVAGMKLGGLAAVGFGVAGYTGGKIIKSFNSTEPIVNKPVETVLKESSTTNTNNIINSENTVLHHT